MILTSPLVLLYIEPTQPKSYDRSMANQYRWFKRLIETAIEERQIGTYTEPSTFNKGTKYLGVHTCVCGAMSTNYDILLPNKMVTNSLAYHYLVYHYIEISPKELEKLTYLFETSKLNIIEPFNVLNHL